MDCFHSEESGSSEKNQQKPKKLKRHISYIMLKIREKGWPEKGKKVYVNKGVGVNFSG